MLKHLVITTSFLLCASAAFAQRDAIDLSRAVVHNSPADVASWPKTGSIRALHMRPESAPEPGLSFEFTTSASWPDYTPPGWDGPIQYTVWAGVNIGGVWHVSGIIQMWRERGATGAPILTDRNFARNWVYDGRWGAMAGYQPVAGETMVFFLTAGNARGIGTVTSVRERTNVVSVALPANDTGDFTFNITNLQTDLLIDNGALGLYTLTDGGSYNRIHPLNPRSMVTGDFDGSGIDELAVDFGPGYGLWIRWNGATWIKLNAASPSHMATGDLDGNRRAELIVDFPGAGVFILWNGAAFAKIHDAGTSRLLVAHFAGASAPGDLVIEFPGGGIWILFSNGSWMKLHALNSTAMVAGDFDGNGREEIALVLPGAGLWVWGTAGSWVKLNANDPIRLAAGKVDSLPASELIADWPGYGIWMLRDGMFWSPLHSQPERQIVLADLDGNGQDEVVIDFGTGGGVWIWANDSSWMQITSSSPEAIVPGIID